MGVAWLLEAAPCVVYLLLLFASLQGTGIVLIKFVRRAGHKPILSCRLQFLILGVIFGCRLPPIQLLSPLKNAR